MYIIIIIIRFHPEGRRLERRGGRLPPVRRGAVPRHLDDGLLYIYIYIHIIMIIVIIIIIIMIVIITITAVILRIIDSSSLLQ